MKFDAKSGPTLALIGMVFQAIMFIIFAIILSATDSIMGWTGTGGNLSVVFPTVNSMMPIIPLLIFVILMLGGAILTGYGVKHTVEEGKLGIAMMLAIVMLAVGLLFYKIILDSAATLLAYATINSYTGLKSVVQISPMLILIMYVFESLGTGVYAGYRGLKGGKE
jgi:hypothetical protein